MGGEKEKKVPSCPQGHWRQGPTSGSPVQLASRAHIRPPVYLDTKTNKTQIILSLTKCKNKYKHKYKTQKLHQVYTPTLQKHWAEAPSETIISSIAMGLSQFFSISLCKMAEGLTTFHETMSENEWVKRSFQVLPIS